MNLEGKEKRKTRNKRKEWERRREETEDPLHYQLTYLSIA